ncbi:NAD(P)-dependent oxidoreductase [Candidatus Bathyarchaeota archaeon]|nr:MAG: NAD(P)-dependent oxidoreductase [Candidatus Bathyarchaeota archaeon]
MAKILVTGGLGFIGSNLVKELRKRGHDVWLCDLRHSEDPKSIRCDVSVFRQVERLFEEHDFEYVYHAAAEYGRWNGEAYYENLWMTNVVGTKNIIRMQEKKRFRMIFFSSAEVYGDYDGVMTEDVMDKVPIKQMNDYAMTKWVNEMQILNSAAMYGTETVRVRLFNVYGPGEHYNPYRGVIPIFIYKALHDEPYTVYLGHKRTFEYVEDICRALGNIIDNFKPGEVYNLGGDKQYEIKYVSDLILKYLGKDDSKVTYKEAEPFTTRIKTPDSSKAKRDLGFKLTVPLEEGIPKTIEWFKKVYGFKE